jgi:hypothetical protein
MTTETTPTSGDPAPEPSTSPESPPIHVRMGWGSAIFQAAMVVLGVILGFLVAEWQADQSERAEARLALKSILEEVVANRDAVAAARGYHAAKVAVIDQSAREKKPLDIRTFERGFVAPAQTSTAAWTSASEIGALAHLPFEQVLALSRLYSQQAAYQQQQATVSNVIYGAIFESGAPGLLERSAGLRAIISTFLYREQQLEETYAAVLDEIKPD